MPPPGRTAATATVRAAVVDPLPLLRHGIAAALADLDCPVDNPDDLLDWARGPATRVVVLSLSGYAEWDLLAELRTARPEALLLALLDRPDTPGYVRAFRAGAMAVLPRQCTPDSLRQSLAALLGGLSIVPIAAVQSLAAGTVTADDRPSPEELEWLRQLAGGSTVAELAQTAGYSERMMFRLLRALYRKLPARNRTEALMYAQGRGWI
jgi:DNA-binding NarL/FixJ family response regulator